MSSTYRNRSSSAQTVNSTHPYVPAKMRTSHRLVQTKLNSEQDPEDCDRLGVLKSQAPSPVLRYSLIWTKPPPRQERMKIPERLHCVLDGSMKIARIKVWILVDCSATSEVLRDGDNCFRVRLTWTGRCSLVFVVWIERSTNSGQNRSWGSPTFQLMPLMTPVAEVSWFSDLWNSSRRSKAEW